MIIYKCNKDKRCKKGEKPMGEIEKALKDLEKALKSNESVARVTVTITLVKPKTEKGKQKE